METQSNSIRILDREEEATGIVTGMKISILLDTKQRGCTVVERA